MDLTINAIHFEATEKLKEFIAKKISRLTHRYPMVMSADVSLRVVKPETAMNKQVIITLAVPGAPDLVADKTADTFEEAVDVSIEALGTQLEKVKNK